MFADMLKGSLILLIWPLFAVSESKYLNRRDTIDFWVLFLFFTIVIGFLVFALFAVQSFWLKLVFGVLAFLGYVVVGFVLLISIAIAMEVRYERVMSC